MSGKVSNSHTCYLTHHSYHSLNRLGVVRIGGQGERGTNALHDVVQTDIYGKGWFCARFLIPVNEIKIVEGLRKETIEQSL